MNLDYEAAYLTIIVLMMALMLQSALASLADIHPVTAGVIVVGLTIGAICCFSD